jgi:hypothetical protein
MAVFLVRSVQRPVISSEGIWLPNGCHPELAAPHAGFSSVSVSVPGCSWRAGRGVGEAAERLGRGVQIRPVDEHCKLVGPALHRGFDLVMQPRIKLSDLTQTGNRTSMPFCLLPQCDEANLLGSRNHPETIVA